MGAFTRKDPDGVAKDLEDVFGYFPVLREAPTSGPARCRAASSRCWRSVTP